MREGKSYAFQKHNHCSIQRDSYKEMQFGDTSLPARWLSYCYVKSFEVQVKCSYNYCPSLFFSSPPIYPYASLPATGMQSECEHGMCTCSPKQALRISQTFFFHCCRLQNKVVRTIPNCCGLLQPLWSCHSISFGVE